MAVIYVVINLAADLICHYLDPGSVWDRRKHSERKKTTIRKQKASRNYTKLKLIVCGTLALLILLAAVFAPYITPYDPYEQDLGRALLAPCREYLLGTDR